jgi:SAM-dependent methyltransferase
VRLMKYKLLNLIRLLGMLGFMDGAKFWLSRALFRGYNNRFIKAHPEFELPPHSLAFDAYNKVDWEDYHDVGLLHAGVLADIIKDNCADHELNILEWGCGPGRIIRHIRILMQTRRVQLTGTDYNRETITWCSKYLPGIEFTDNELMPPLTFDDSQFDVTYNFSVLTHLSEGAQKAWVDELWRILKPGGLLICTTHGHQYTHLLTRPEEHQRYQQGEVVVQDRYAEGKKWFLSIHPEQFVKESLLKSFTGIQRVAVPARSKMLQDVWIARKP